MVRKVQSFQRITTNTSIARPFTMAKVGIGAGVGLALVLSSLWFVGMLKTSEMPH